MALKWNIPPNLVDFMENSTAQDGSSEWSCPTRVTTAKLYKIHTCMDESYYLCLLRNVEDYITEEISSYQPLQVGNGDSSQEHVYEVPENSTQFPAKIYMALNTSADRLLRFHGLNPNPSDQHLFLAFTINKNIYDACNPMALDTDSGDLIEGQVSPLFYRRDAYLDCGSFSPLIANFFNTESDLLKSVAFSFAERS